jgi:putative transposase
MTEEELRRHAIDRYVNGQPPKSIYDGLGRTKQWFFKWLKRFQSGDPQWYLTRSQAPHSKPTRTSEVDRERIINIRRRLQAQSFAQIGASAIKWELHKGGENVPSDSTINRVLKQEGLIKKNTVRPERG